MENNEVLPKWLPVTPKTNEEASDYLDSLCESDVSSRSLWNRYQKHRADGKSIKESINEAIAGRKEEMSEFDKVMAPGGCPQTVEAVYSWTKSGVFEEEMAIGIKDRFTIAYAMSSEANVELSLVYAINAVLNDGRKKRSEREGIEAFYKKHMNRLIDILSGESAGVPE